MAIGLEKASFHFNPKKGNAKDYSNNHKIALTSHANKVMLKILQARLQQYVNCELPEVQLILEKVEEPEVKFSNISWLIEKVRQFQK